MAIVLTNGNLSGKLKGLVYTSRNGITYVRISGGPNKSRTSKQHNQRAKFQATSRFVGQIHGSSSNLVNADTQ